MVKSITIQKSYVGPKHPGWASLYIGNDTPRDIKLSCVTFHSAEVVLRYYNRIGMAFEDVPILYDNFVGLCIKIT